MSYRQQVRDILSSQVEHYTEPHRELVNDLAKALYSEYQRGYDEGLYSVHTEDLETDRQGTYMVYTDPIRGLTFECGGKAYIHVLDKTYTIERITKTDICLSDDTGLCETFPIECCRPICGYDTEGFLPLDAIVIRSDGQLGIVQQDEEGRFIIYGDYLCKDYNLSVWDEYNLEEGTWVATPSNTWYQVVRVGDLIVELDDDGPRYIGRRLPLHDSFSITALRINPPNQRYFVGQRIFAIAEGKFGYIVEQVDTETWRVQFDAMDSLETESNNLVSFEFYYGQSVIYNGLIYTIKLIYLSLVDGRWQPIQIGVSDDSSYTLLTLKIDDSITPLTKIDTIGDLDLWMDVTDLGSLHDVLSFENHFSDLGARQVASIGRYLGVI